MLNSAIVRIVDFSARRRWYVIVVGIVLAAGAAAYDVARFSITTDTESLISPDLPWRQRQAALSDAFPEKGISVVVTAATPENVEQAASALAQNLSKHADLFR
jgi:predicted RND superfamily exporter protein